MTGKMIFTRGDGHNNAYIFQLEPTNTGGLFIETEKSGYDVTIDNDTYSYFPNYNLEESKTATSHSFRDTYLRNFIKALRVFHFHDTSNTSAPRKECDVNDNRTLRTDGANLPAFLYYLNLKHPKTYNRIIKTIQSVAPYIDSFILEPRRLSNQDEEIALRWADAGAPESLFSAYQLSDGTLRFIALATLLMQPNPPEVIIIDEPELGLHPFAIGKLAGMIQAAAVKTQVIAATQSPGLISHLTPEDVIVIDRSEKENGSAFHRLSSDELSNWLQDFSLGDLWERNIINAAQPFGK